MFIKECGKKWIAILITLLMVFQAGCSFAADKTYVISGDSCTATIKNITSKNRKLYVTYNYKNSKSKKDSFGYSFTVSVFQDGYECERDYFDSASKNNTTEVKDGANVDVVLVYTLRNNTSLVDITTEKLFSWSSTETVVYFNPQNQKWGTKAEASSTATNTPKPTNTPKMEEADNSWICPDCGKKLTSKFCPDCGVSSPTPKPTETPTPAPTTVPMDTNKPVENVVKKEYTLIDGDKKTDGEYTGEMVDGFPHGYGIFVVDDSVYYAGNWSYGKPCDDEGVTETSSKDKPEESNLVVRDETYSHPLKAEMMLLDSNWMPLDSYLVGLDIEKSGQYSLTISSDETLLGINLWSLSIENEDEESTDKTNMEGRCIRIDEVFVDDKPVEIKKNCTIINTIWYTESGQKDCYRLSVPICSSIDPEDTSGIDYAYWDGDTGPYIDKIVDPEDLGDYNSVKVVFTYGIFE